MPVRGLGNGASYVLEGVRGGLGTSIWSNPAGTAAGRAYFISCREKTNGL